MRISFDLDDTLICYQPGVPAEPPAGAVWRWLGLDEPLRLGAAALLRGLSAHGHDVWVYTTSYRPPFQVRCWLRGYGVRVGRVINQHVHDRYLRRHRNDRPPSKNPRAFGIHLHVDDSEGVAIEGRQHGFRVVVIDPLDTDWTRKVLSVVG